MILLDKDRIKRTIKRMTYQILEETRDRSICLVGLNERGFAVAKMIRSQIEQIREEPVTLLQFDSHSDTNEIDFPENQENSILILIDDVIFSGQTMFTSLKKITERSHFEMIFVVVLVDRGHRKYPVLAGIVGLDAPTKLNEHVELRLSNGNPGEVILIEK